MNKMNNKGFLLVESLIVSTFVLTILMFLYLQFNSLMTNHKKSYTYNSVENIYDLGSMSDFLKNTNQDSTLKTNLGSNNYILLYNGSSCINIPNTSTTSTCNSLASAMNLKYMIYTDSDITGLKEYVKTNTSDTNLKQDMRDFITKVDAVKVEGKGRLIAKFGDSVNDVSSNDRFATVAIDTGGSVSPNSNTITYSFYKYNDLNNWRYLNSAAADKSLDYAARDIFTIKNFNEGTQLNEINVKTMGGSWENVYIPLSTVSGTQYTVSFDYRTLENFNNLSGYTSVELQALSSVPTNSNCRTIQHSSTVLNKSRMDSIATSNITFTANSSNTYLTVNFGMAADGQIVKLLIGNFRIQKTLSTSDSVYGNQLNPYFSNHTFNGWYTEKEGGTRIDAATRRYTNEDQVLYARMN